MEQKIDNTSNTAGLLCLPIVMEKKIVNISTIDVHDNNFGFDSHHDCDLAFVLDHDTACDNKQRPTYRVHQYLFYIYGVDIDCDHDHMLVCMLLQYNECNDMTFPFPLLWK